MTRDPASPSVPPSGAAEPSLVGRSLDDAVASVAAAATIDADEAAIREALDRACEDGVITLDALHSSVAHVSKVVSTPETRLELADDTVADARSAADPHADLGVVHARLEALEARLDRLDDRTAGLSDDLGDIVDRLGDRLDDPETVYAVSRDVQRLEVAANRTQGTIDELAMDAESFERWLSSPAVRYDDLEDDVDAAAEMAASLEHVADAPDSRTAWIDAACRRRVLDLLVADLRAELADCRRLDDRQGVERDERAASCADRLDDIADRSDALADRLDACDRAGRRDHAAADLAALDAALVGFDTPIDWAGVQAALDDHRPAPP